MAKIDNTISARAKKYSRLDSDIRRLVAVMNACGFRTYASCQGHGYPVDSLKPYIAFTSDLFHAGRLARSLRNDSESPTPMLRWGWEIVAGFNDEFRLCYRLHPTTPHNWWSRYCRSSLIRDFGSICQLVKFANSRPFRLPQRPDASAWRRCPAPAAGEKQVSPDTGVSEYTR